MCNSVYSFSQAIIHSPLNLEDGHIYTPANSFWYPKLATDVNTFDDGGPLHQIIAFVTDHAGSAGNDLQISIIIL